MGADCAGGLEESGQPMGSGKLLWKPSEQQQLDSGMGQYRQWLRRRIGLAADDYAQLWRFSVEQPERFWKSLFDYFQLGPEPTEVLHRTGGTFDVQWFRGSTLNYAQRLVEGPPGAMRPEHEAVVAISETATRSLTREQLKQQVALCRGGLQRAGVQRGDFIVGYLGNGLPAVVSMLAAASMGAIWSSCPPEFGAQAVVDRWAQLGPTVLLAQPHYVHGGRRYDRRGELGEILKGLPSVHLVVSVDDFDPSPQGADGSSQGAPPESERTGVLPRRQGWQQLLSGPASFQFDSLPFEHPLWVVFSSGTTGLPKPIVHGHGGMLLEHLKVLTLHHDLRPLDRFFWYTTTGWMMWNYLCSGLAAGACIVLYDGSPAHPDLSRLWRLAAEQNVTCFGVSAPFLMACRAAGLRPNELSDWPALRSIGSTGAPLAPEGFQWVYEAVKRDVLLASASGGTDLCTAFVGPCPLLPVFAGQLQCLALGAHVQAWNSEGQAVVGEVGELVIVQPMPCMPLYFANDPGGKRYRDSYFEFFPGVWRHGDWISILPTGAAVISGRSDATLNRGGVRMGSSDFYRVVEQLPWVANSLVVDTSDAAGKGQLWLFLELRAGEALTEQRVEQLRATLRTQLSPRHLPDELRAIAEVPVTASGKKLEVPVKRLLLGEPAQQVVNRGALKNPEAWDQLLEVVRPTQA